MAECVGGYLVVLWPLPSIPDLAVVTQEGAGWAEASGDQVRARLQGGRG